MRRLSGSIGGITLVLTSALIFGCIGPSLLARPHLLALPVLLLWTIELLTARGENRAPRLAMALLMVVWANLHSSYIIGLGLAGAFGLEALVEAKQDRAKVVRDWGLFGLASLAAALITPNGVTGLIYPFQVMGMSSLPGIVEWRATDFAALSPFEVALLVTIFVCLWRGVRVPVVRLMVLLGLLYLALEHTRHQLILAMVAPLILAQPLAVALGQTQTQTQTLPRARWGLPALFAGAAVLIGLRLMIPVARVDAINSPVSAIAHLPPDLARQPVLNSYGFGGLLIYKGIRPFIDGRSDMYGDAYTRAYFAAKSASPSDLNQFLNRYNIAWTLFAPNDPIVAVLDQEPGWKRIYSDGYAVIHRRSAALAGVRAAQAPSR